MLAFQKLLKLPTKLLLLLLLERKHNLVLLSFLPAVQQFELEAEKFDRQDDGGASEHLSRVEHTSRSR
jgi:hypothetical protein